MTDHRKEISATRVVITSFLVDFSDVVLSLIVAVLSGSVIMISQVLEGLSDLASSGFLLVGLNRSRREPDPAHPFGYGREIYFWALLSALVMFGITATFSIYLGWQRFLNPEEVHSLPLTFAVLIITLVTNGYAFLLSWKRLLRRRSVKRIVEIFYKSSLVETKTTFILDLMGAAASALGIISLGVYAITGDYRFDGIGAMLIGFVIAICAVFLVLGIRDLLIGQSASPEIENKIREAILDFPEVKKVLDLKTLHIGIERLLVNVEVYLTGEMRIIDIEKLMDDIKAHVQKLVPSVKHIQVELETPDRK